MNVSYQNHTLMFNAISREVKLGLRLVRFPVLLGRKEIIVKNIDFGGKLPGLGFWLCHSLSE